MPVPQKILELVARFCDSFVREVGGLVFDLYGLSEEERMVVLNS
jgi:hypothetical protein